MAAVAARCSRPQQAVVVVAVVLWEKLLCEGVRTSLSYECRTLLADQCKSNEKLGGAAAMCDD